MSMEPSPPMCALCQRVFATGYSETSPICASCCNNFPSTQVASLCKRCGQTLGTGLLACKCSDKSPVKYTESPSFNPCWTCSQCHYKDNITEKCLECQSPHVSFQPLIPSVPAVLAPSPAPKAEKASQGQWSCYQNTSTGWELWGCGAGHSMNTMQDLVCRTCDLVSAHPNASGIAANSAGKQDEAAAPWVCFACGQQNTGKRQCLLCGCLRTWAGYLQCSRMELSSDQMKWKCIACGDFNALEEGICSECHRSEPLIMRWAQPQKLDTPTGAQAFSCGCCSPQ